MARKFIDWYTAVGLGYAGENYPINIFGYNAAVGTAFIPAWEDATVYTFPSSATAMEIVSDNSGDTQTALVFGLDTDYNVINETVTLTGLTPANINTSVLRINSIILLNGQNAGTITVRPQGGGTTYAKILPEVSKTQMSIFSVPADYRLAIYRIDAYCATAIQNNRILDFRNEVNNSVTGQHFHVAQTEFRTELKVDRNVPYVYTEHQDIQLQVKASAGTQFVSIFAEGVLHKYGDAFVPSLPPAATP